MRLLAATALTLCAIATTGAQQRKTEYGKPEELKGLTKIFIDTNGDLEERARIIKVIEKASLGVELLDSEEGAEIVMVFTGSKFRDTPHTSINVGEGRVIVIRGDSERLVLSYKGDEQKIWEDKPATNFGKAFVKAYKKVNGKK